MTHTKIKSIRFTPSEVIINVVDSELSATKRKHHGLSEVLQKEGREAAEKQILMNFFVESFQGNGRYRNAVDRVLCALNLTYGEAWQKCFSDPTYAERLKELFYRELRSPSKNQRCCLEIAGGLRINNVTRKRVQISIQNFRIFDNPKAAQDYIQKKHLNPYQVRIVLLTK